MTGVQTCALPIFHNYLSDAKTVTVSVAADGLSTVDANGAPTAAAPPRSVQVPQNGQQRTDWQFAAGAVRPVTLTGKVTSDVAGDAMAVTLPVNAAGLQRNTGTSGSLVGTATEKTVELTVPQTANASARTVRVSLAPSLAGTMLGGLEIGRAHV